jgi:hypothetical protein
VNCNYRKIHLPVNISVTPVSWKTLALPCITTSVSTKNFRKRTLQRHMSTDVQKIVSKVFLPLHVKRPVSVVGSHTQTKF